MGHLVSVQFIFLLLWIIADGRVIPRHLLLRSGLHTFPEGSYEDIETLNFINSNLNELKANVFFDRKFNNLKKIILRYTSITSIHPGAFNYMFQVVQLDLYGNKLSAFDGSTFEGLKSLKHFNLGHNRINSIDEEVLKPLRSLVTFDLSYNSLTTFGRNLLKYSLIRELNLQGNPLVFQEPDAILESYYLVRLNLQSCNLETLPSHAFSRLPKLESLDLSNNQLKVLPKGLLKHQTSLDYLDISFNSIVNIDIDVFHTPINLDELACDGNPLGVAVDCGELREKLQEKSESESFTTGKDDFNHQPSPEKSTESSHKKQEENGSSERKVLSSDNAEIPVEVLKDKSNVLFEENTNNLGLNNYGSSKTGVTNIKNETNFSNSSSEDGPEDNKLNEGVKYDSGVDVEDALLYAILAAGVICLLLVSLVIYQLFYIFRTS